MDWSPNGLGLVVCGVNGVVTYVNEEARFLRLSPGLLPFDQAIVDGRARENVVVQVPPTGEARTCGVDPRSRSLVLTIAPYRDLSGNVAGTVALFRDITAEIPSEDEKLTFPAGMSEGIGVFDPTGPVIVNPTALRLFGAGPSQDLGLAGPGGDVKTPALLPAASYELSDGRLADLAERPESRVLAGETLTNEEWTLHARDGVTRLIGVSGTAVGTDGGRPLLAMLTYRDLTRGTGLERIQSAYLHGLARELEDLLETSCRIVGLLARSSPGVRPAWASGRLAEVVGGIARLRQAAKEVADDYLVIRERSPLVLEVIDLADMVRRLKGGGGRIPAGKVVLGPVPKPPITVVGDRKRLTQVLCDLVHTASECAPPKARAVAVSLGLERDSAWVSVEPVRPPACEAAPATPSDNRGRDLVVDAGIARRHGGELRVEDQRDGTRSWRLRLPVLPGGSSTPGRTSPTSPRR